jgi:hypothetical protein
MPFVTTGSRRGARTLLAALGAAGACAAAASPALADTTPLGATQIQFTDASYSTCVNPSFVRPYTNLGDSRTYVVAPAGTFNAGATGWQLQGGARLASDATRGTSLVLPAGASAVSPAACIDLDYPHLRLAHKATGWNPSGVELKTEVVYPQVRNPQWVEVKQFDPFQGDAVGSGWRVSPDVDLKPDLGGSSWGARPVAVRFTAVKKAATSAEVRVDDVFIDPYARR